MRLFATLFMTFLLAVPLVAQSQQQESLGDLARQIRAQRSKETQKPTKVFTNDNLPEPKAGEPISPGASTAAPASPQSATSPTAPEKASQASSPHGKQETREYWQEKFKAARQTLAKAKELQQLSEDELNLLQIQEVRELNPDTKRDLTSRVQAKQSEVDTNKAATEAAQKSLQDLEKAFQASGAPDDWSKTE